MLTAGMVDEKRNNFKNKTECLWLMHEKLNELK